MCFLYAALAVCVYVPGARVTLTLFCLFLEPVHVQQTEDRAADQSPEHRVVQAQDSAHTSVHFWWSYGRKKGVCAEEGVIISVASQSFKYLPPASTVQLCHLLPGSTSYYLHQGGHCMFLYRLFLGLCKNYSTNNPYILWRVGAWPKKCWRMQGFFSFTFFSIV